MTQKCVLNKKWRQIRNMRIEGGEGIRTLINSLSAKYLVSAGERIAALPPHRKDSGRSYSNLNCCNYLFLNLKH